MQQRGKSFVFSTKHKDHFAFDARDISGQYSMHYNQNEEFFIRLKHEFEVGHFDIHHNVENLVPPQPYLRTLKAVLDQLHLQIPDLLHGLNYAFDPADILRPCFYTLYRSQEQTYIYILRIDLTPRSNSGRILERGTNDTTASYLSRDLFIESELIPLAEIKRGTDTLHFSIQQTISETWIGETGRGYFVQGIWIDRDLTKFFSKLYMPTGHRVHPYYPFNCHYRSVCAPVYHFDSQGRRQALQNLHLCRQFLEAHMRTIETALRQSEFNENSEAFVQLKAQINAPKITEQLAKASIRSYLNSKDMKEYELSFSD